MVNRYFRRRSPCRVRVEPQIIRLMFTAEDHIRNDCTAVGSALSWWNAQARKTTNLFPPPHRTPTTHCHKGKKPNKSQTLVLWSVKRLAIFLPMIPSSHIRRSPHIKSGLYDWTSKPQRKQHSTGSKHFLNHINLNHTLSETRCATVGR